LQSLPPFFYIQDADYYLAAEFGAGMKGGATLTEVSSQADATVFYITNAPVESFGQLNQLAFNSTDATSGDSATHAAWVQGSPGGAVTFFSTSTAAANLTTTNYYPVLGAVSYLSCSLGLGAFLNKYVDWPSNCGGVIWLDTVENVSGCVASSLTVSTATI